MKNKVILNLETYNEIIEEKISVKNEMENLRNQLLDATKIRYSYKKEVEDYRKENGKLKLYILDQTFNKYNYRFTGYNLEELLNENGIFKNEYENLINLGIALESIKCYITKHFNELNKKEEVKENE